MKSLNKLLIGALALPIAVVPAITTCCSNNQEKSETVNFDISNDGLVTIKDSAKSLTDVTIPATINDIKVQGIDTNGFKGSKVETVSFENASQITRINEYAFKDCTSLKAFKVPENVTYLGASSFSGCTSLQTFIFATGIRLQTLREKTFENTDLYEINIPATVMTMEKNLFAYSGSSRLTKVNFSNITGWTQNGVAIPEGDMKPDNCSAHFRNFNEKGPNNWGYTGIERTPKTANVDYSDSTLSNFTFEKKVTSITEKDGQNKISFDVKTTKEEYNGEYVIWVNNASGYLLTQTIYTIDSYNWVNCMLVIDNWSYITTEQTVTIKAMKK